MADKDNTAAEDEFDDLPALEEPDLETMEAISASLLSAHIIDSADHTADTVPTQHEPLEETDIIEINAPSNEPASIFCKQAEATKSNDIFANIVSDDSDESDYEDEEQDAVENAFVIEEVSSSNNKDMTNSLETRRPIIEEVHSSKIEDTTAAPSRSTPKSEPSRETLLEPSVPPKNPFLITEVQSTDISDMFSTQDALLSDDVEQMYVGDAHDDDLQVVRPGGGGEEMFFSKLGAMCGENSKPQG